MIKFLLSHFTHILIMNINEHITNTTVNKKYEQINELKVSL